MPTRTLHEKDCWCARLGLGESMHEYIGREKRMCKVLERRKRSSLRYCESVLVGTDRRGNQRRRQSVLGMLAIVRPSVRRHHTTEHYNVPQTFLTNPHNSVFIPTPPTPIPELSDASIIGNDFSCFSPLPQLLVWGILTNPWAKRTGTSPISSLYFAEIETHLVVGSKQFARFLWLSVSSFIKWGNRLFHSPVVRPKKANKCKIFGI